MACESACSARLRKSNSQPALNILRLFVERFVANEIKTLRNLPEPRSSSLAVESHAAYDMLEAQALSFLELGARHKDMTTQEGLKQSCESS